MVRCWRWLFSAHAEVFPPFAGITTSKSALLRTRGGISNPAENPYPSRRSSPHTRRYFPHDRTSFLLVVLFSAHAEVFPTSGQDYRLTTTLLRTRGGISHGPLGKYRTRNSSPHTRRYFPSPTHGMRKLALFSAHAEVFPTSPPTKPPTPSLLRTRGGISGSRPMYCF